MMVKVAHVEDQMNRQKGFSPRL